MPDTQPPLIPGLVLSRYEGESLVLEHPEFGLITIAVEEARGGSASLRVAADRAWQITRRSIGRATRHQHRQQRPRRVSIPACGARS